MDAITGAVHTRVEETHDVNTRATESNTKAVTSQPAQESTTSLNDYDVRPERAHQRRDN